MENSWLNNVTATSGVVMPVRNNDGFAALLCWQDGVAALRIPESLISSEKTIDAMEQLARQHAVSRIETQGKFVSNSLPARLLRQRGFSGKGPLSVHFKVEITKARERLRLLERRFVRQTMDIASLSPEHLTPIAEIVQNELILDSFELHARLTHQGFGAIHADECPVMIDHEGLAGFALTCRVADPTERELMVRWVASRHRRSAKGNFALMLECLDRAAAAGVVTAYFSANPQRHGDTIRLARVLEAEPCGESLALVRDL